MGGVESHFNNLLVEGKDEEAIKLWEENFELQAKHHPNSQIKASPFRDTPLHCAVRFEMKKMVQEFLSRGGDPFVMNGNGETPLHIVCRASKISSRRAKKRAELLQLLLDKVPKEEQYELIGNTSARSNGVVSRSMKEERKREEKKLCMQASLGDNIRMMTDRDAHQLGTRDRARNTPLHLAAASGLLECVELLVAHDAPLFIHNVADLTPCDVAWKAKEIVIAKQLESIMVLDSDVGRNCEAKPIKRARNKTFHNTHTLKGLRQDIVTNIAKKLQITDFSAQALLMTYGWSEELLTEAWSSDRATACERAGISLESVTQEEGSLENGASPYSSLTLRNCEICYEEINPQEKVSVPCQHNFCESCWKMYIENQISEGGGKEIRCPAHQCFKIVPDKVIARLVSEAQMDKYTDLTIKQFVDSSADIRWCPYPDCGYAVCIRREDSKEESKATGGACTNKLTPGENVECGQGHGFCWHCLKDPHQPCSCELWEKWKNIVITNISEEDKDKIAREAQANAHWIIRNTKPCPNCQSPIQKDEGCNHMTCKKCRHNFCWVCLDPWRLHSHRTGGYFTCNRWNVQARADKDVEKARSTMEKEYVNKAYQDLETQHSKFEHYHERYNNHLQSLDIEIKLLQESQAKLREMERIGNALDKKMALVRAKVLIDSLDSTEEIDAEEFADNACRSFPHLKGNFLDDIFRALLHARRILAASYCIGYFIPEEKPDVLQAHDTLQGKLESAVETLSQMVNREYLLTPQHAMSEAAHNVEFLCEEYLLEMQEVAMLTGRMVMGIEDEERRIERERERERERAQRLPSPPTLEELLFLDHLMRLMDGNGRLHIFMPPQGQH